MTLELWYWIFMALWLFFGIWRARVDAQPFPYFGGHAIVFVLFLIVGWRIFGAPVK